MKKKNLANLLPFVAVTVIGVTVGYLGATALNDEKTPATEMTSSLGGFLPRHPATAAVEPIEGTHAITQIKVFQRRGDRRQAAARLFRKTKAGLLWADVAGYWATGNNPGLPHSRQMKEALAELKRMPLDAFDELKFSLPGVPMEFEAERRFLFQFAVQLEVSDSAKIDLLKREITRGTSTSGESQSSQAIALETLMQMTADPQQVESILVPYLSEHRGDTATVELLLSHYATRYPDRGVALASRIGIDY